MKIRWIARQRRTGAIGQQGAAAEPTRSEPRDNQKNQNVQFRQKRQSNLSTTFLGGIKVPVMVKMSANSVNLCAEKDSSRCYLLFWREAPSGGGIAATK